MQPTSDEVWTAEDEATYRPLREKSEYQKVKENIINDIEGTIDKIQDMLRIVCPSDCKNCDYSDLCTDSTKTTNTNLIPKDSCPKCLSRNLELEDSDVGIKWYCCDNCSERFEVVEEWQ